MGGVASGSEYYRDNWRFSDEQEQVDGEPNLGCQVEPQTHIE